MERSGEPEDSIEAASSPRTMREKYSGDRKLEAISARTGEKAARRNRPTIVPTKEPILVMKSATPARPSLAIG